MTSSAMLVAWSATRSRLRAFRRKSEFIDQVELEPVQAWFLETLGNSRRQQRILQSGVQCSPIPPGEPSRGALCQQIVGVNAVLQHVGRRALVILIER